MAITYKAGVARNQLHRILSQLEASKDPITIERNEKPVAVLMDYTMYEQIMNAVSLLTLASSFLQKEKKNEISKVSQLYGSLKPKKKIVNLEEAIQKAKEEHILKKFSKS